MFWLAALAGYSLFLAAGFWFPFELTRDHALIVSRLDEFFRVPLYSLYLGNEFNALQQLLVRLLLFAPIGVLWAHIASLAGTTRVRRLLAFVGIVYSACLAFGIEAAQVLMPSKIADFTEVLICTAGALGGLYVTLGLLPSRSRDVPTEL
jgi:glycopeptide antibiotics resistance protein